MWPPGDRRWLEDRRRMSRIGRGGEGEGEDWVGKILSEEHGVNYAGVGLAV